MKLGTVWAILICAASSFAQSILITERQGQLFFNVSHMLSHRIDSFKVWNWTEKDISLKAYLTKNPAASNPASQWIDLGHFPKYQKRQLVFGDGVQDLKNHPECATQMSCVWIKAELGDHFDLTDPSLPPQVIPFHLGIYIFKEKRPF